MLPSSVGFRCLFLGVPTPPQAVPPFLCGLPSSSIGTPVVLLEPHLRETIPRHTGLIVSVPSPRRRHTRALRMTSTVLLPCPVPLAGLAFRAHGLPALSQRVCAHHVHPFARSCRLFLGHPASRGRAQLTPLQPFDMCSCDEPISVCPVWLRATPRAGAVPDTVHRCVTSVSPTLA